MLTIYSTGLTLYHFHSFSKHDDVLAAAIGRHGGISRPPFSSLNASFRVGDDHQSVARNRARIALALGIDFNSLVAAQQVHGTNVVVVGGADRGRGAVAWEDAVPDADALVTAERDVFLLMTFADCVPIVLADPVRGAIGLVHAGWKGTVGGIAARAVEAMVRELGADTRRMLAAVGPAIGPCCYEVKSEVIDAARAAGLPESALLVKDDGHVHFDLWQANRALLLSAGLSEEHVEVAATCPSCRNHLFFSHRAEKGQTGRFAVVAGLRGR